MPRYATVVLEARSGDVEAVGLLGDQRYRTASGDVALRTVSGRFQSMSGDLQVVRPVLVESPTPPLPLSAPAAGIGHEAPVSAAIVAAYDEARLRILRSLERGEIDVAEAGRRLETLDAGNPSGVAFLDRGDAATTAEQRSNG